MARPFLALGALQSALYLFLSPLSYASECDKLQSGSGRWSDCIATQVFREADAKLNTAYKNVLSLLDDEYFKEQKQALVLSQRTWLKYREQYCDFEYSICSGSGDICASTLTNCRSSLSFSRAEELDRFRKEWINEP